MNRAGKIVLSVIGLFILLLLLALTRDRDTGPYFGVTSLPTEKKLAYNIVVEPASIDPQKSKDNNIFNYKN